jgi:hypothetical protein
MALKVGRVAKNASESAIAAFAIANAAVAVARSENNANNRTYAEAKMNENGMFGGVTKHFVYTGNVTLSGVIANVANIIPAGSYVTAVTARVTSTASGASGLRIGDSTINDAFANGISVAVNSVSSMTTSNTSVTFPRFYRSEANVTISANSGASLSGGVVRVAVHGIIFDPPTS